MKLKDLAVIKRIQNGKHSYWCGPKYEDFASLNKADILCIESDEDAKDWIKMFNDYCLANAIENTTHKILSLQEALQEQL